ncbi:MAG TPA: hypothetical protein VKD72_03110 [Gemmataceae bacterium]|nr:hypothetical protein [Gemmataceae bacterium]
MRTTAVFLAVLICLAVLGGALVAAPPAKVPPAPPSVLLKVVDHVALQAGQHMEFPIDSAGYQKYTVFYEVDFSGAAPDLNDCVGIDGLTGLGQNLDHVVSDRGGGSDACNRGALLQGFASGFLIGPDFVMTLDTAPDKTPPSSISVMVYLH